MIPSHLLFRHYIGQCIHIGVCGSIAAYKTLDITRDFLHSEMQVSVTLTKAAQEFITPLSFEALGAEPVYSNMFIDSKYRTYGHLEPGQNAQALLIIPATANHIAKLSHGLADDMLSCQALAFPRPIVVAPAMNPNLWNAQATQENIQKLNSRKIHIIQPETGEVACGDQGKGKLASLQDIYFHTLKAISNQDLLGKKILITLGPTREFWDPVRFWSNPSSGKMGAALATAAWLRGAEVHCVCGPNELWLPQDIYIYPVLTAQEMYNKCVTLWPECDIACLSAAVCDFRPTTYGTQKFKKNSLQTQFLQVQFISNPDILYTLGQSKNTQQKLIGFAAETVENLIDLARSKLKSKNLDLIVANRINQENSGFDTYTNEVLVLNKHNNSEELPLMNKADVAWRVWDWILRT